LSSGISEAPISDCDSPKCVFFCGEPLALYLWYDFLLLICWTIHSSSPSSTCRSLFPDVTGPMIFSSFSSRRDYHLRISLFRLIGICGGSLPVLIFSFPCTERCNFLDSRRREVSVILSTFLPSCLSPTVFLQIFFTLSACVGPFFFSLQTFCPLFLVVFFLHEVPFFSREILSFVFPTLSLFLCLPLRNQRFPGPLFLLPESSPLPLSPRSVSSSDPWGRRFSPLKSPP